VPTDYACIGCDVSVADHETIFETRESRIARRATVDDAYIPLSDMVNIRERAMMSGSKGPSSTGDNHRPLLPVNNPTRRRYQPMASDAATIDINSFRSAIDDATPPPSQKHTTPSDAVVVVRKTVMSTKIGTNYK